MPSVHLRLLSWLTLTMMMIAGCSDPQPEGTSTAGSTETSAPEYPVTWRFALEEIEGSVQHAYALEFKERIESRSDGNIELDIFPYGSLGTSAQLTDLTRDGSVHLAFASPGHLAETVPEVGVFTLHFVLSDDNDINRQVLASDELMDLFSESYAEHDMKLLGFVPEGWMVWTANKPLRTPDDFSGLKIRTMTAPISAEAYRAYGADPRPTPYSQVYSDLQLQRIEAQVNPVFAIEEMGFYEVQSTMTFARPAQFVASVVSNQQWYQQLPDDQKQWLREALADVGEQSYQQQAELNASRLDRILSDGNVTTVELTEDERSRFREASLPVRDAYVETVGERGEKILEEILALVNRLEQEQSAQNTARD